MPIKIKNSGFFLLTIQSFVFRSWAPCCNRVVNRPCFITPCKQRYRFNCSLPTNSRSNTGRVITCVAGVRRDTIARASLKMDAKGLTVGHFNRMPRSMVSSTRRRCMCLMLSISFAQNVATTPTNKCDANKRLLVAALTRHHRLRRLRTRIKPPVITRQTKQAPTPVHPQTRHMSWIQIVTISRRWVVL